ncbi:MAG: UDP-N-acetylglucosamine 1-carboxyvinyltransferase [Candidatus Neomarinimicrobiota bacterium]|nr:UDP-N-acetylglucosamine 1-carboxyvinyltransferase [Candidatus Neomarinimicrobiota bacterium]MEC8706535.1 UDP-N-acetylglucosamine 1-carboxyvinyltransferase [Candidatus Neomarinimicrobiota bacterium]
MDKLVIHGGNPLQGDVKISGAKNAVLPIMASSLLVDGITVIRNVPDLRDTKTFIKLLEILGAKCVLDGSTLSVDASDINSLEAPYDLVKTMRASFYVMGPLLGRFGETKVSLPGGCAWGPRPVDYHLKGFEKLGASIDLNQGYILARTDKLCGAEISFEIASVGATANILMAAVLADGATVINNAAVEPHIVQLCEVLIDMGAIIDGVGTHKLKIEGVSKLNPVEVQVIPDMIEAGTFLMAGATLGDIKLIDVDPSHLNIVLEKLDNVGCDLSLGDNSISIKQNNSILASDITTDVHPGFPTDLQAQWIALMSVADGTSVVTETIYLDRFSHVPVLVRLGANITLENNIAIVRGQKSLTGAQVMSTDIRASASLVIAALIADGRSDISRIYHIDRGYEKIEEKFKLLGADITREKE